jgi:folate-dependent phosphoribosylglycinamide formyltransferase PurN
MNGIKTNQKKVVILTGSELRHSFFRKYIGFSKEIDVLRSYCEGEENNLRSLVSKQSDSNRQRLRHLEARTQSEIDFFQPFVDFAEDKSNPVFIPRGHINNADIVQDIINLQPDLLVAYGCSLIKPLLIDQFKNRFLNVHLGLSPYYRGSGTNYWPLVNGEPEYVGATFMHIDSGVDTGDIIHQMRARIFPWDSPADVGNRLIVEMTKVYRDIIVLFSSLKKMPPLPEPKNSKYYKNADFDETSVQTLYHQWERGLFMRYAEEEASRIKNVPIIQNPALEKRV